MAQFEDEVTRAMDRNGVSRESPMERLVRQNLYNIAAANYEDQSDRDRKIDQFISRQRSDPYFSSSFAERQQKTKTEDTKRPTDLMNLTPAELHDIAMGKLKVG